MTELSISLDSSDALAEPRASARAIAASPGPARTTCIDGSEEAYGSEGSFARDKACGSEARFARAEACGSEEVSERDLVERAKRDPQAFAAIYRAHYAPIAGYIYRRVGDVHATDDLVAEVFLTAMRSLRGYRYRGVPIRAWLYRIATNTVNRQARRLRRRPVEHLGGNSLESRTRAAPPDERVDASGPRRAMLALSPKHQAVLALHYLEGLSLEEVAAVIGCRIGTVKSRLSRAREALRDRLSRGR